MYFEEQTRHIYPFFKRGIDVVISLIALIALMPVFFLVAFAVKVFGNGSVLFWSERTGYGGRPFLMPKFRTMSSCSKVMSRETACSKDIQITKVGYILRKTSLDEIPQLWSILRGDMSLIGPRPLLVNDRASSHRNKFPEILKIRPGLTGLAQVNGRNFISVRNKVRYDLFYAQRACFILDAKILFKTISAVIDFKKVQ